MCTASRFLALVAGVALVALAGCAGDDPDGLLHFEPGCAPEGGIGYVCGVLDPEDIVEVGDSKWLIASSVTPRGDAVGASGFYLVDSRARAAEPLFPGPAPVFRPDPATYPDCGPPDLAHFDTHGLALRETDAPGVYRLYMTSHGALEAIQAFELDARSGKPTVAWVGCVPMPAHAWNNSVVILEDGGFLATKFYDPDTPGDIEAMLAGGVNGVVFEWRPGGPVVAVEGTELSGPNGIELSADGRYLYVAAFGAHRVVRYDRAASPMTATAVELGIMPDNLRWTPEGTLLTVGGDVAQPPSCAAPPCAPGWSVWEIDPDAMTARRLLSAPSTLTLQNVSTALEVGDALWLGSSGSDRMGYTRAP